MLAEWHLPPEYIIERWTDEEFSLMVEKLAARKRLESEAISGKQCQQQSVPEGQFFEMAHIHHIEKGEHSGNKRR